MAQKPRTLNCSSCGAPLKINTEKHRQYCHAMAELPDDQQPPHHPKSTSSLTALGQPGFLRLPTFLTSQFGAKKPPVCR